MATWYVWTMDDVGAGGSDMVEAMRRACAFLQSRGVRMTLFVVPKPSGQPMSEEWVDALREAHEAGHDLQLHGLTHEDCFEFGPRTGRQRISCLLSSRSSNVGARN